jgi:hypothetical protein
MRRIRSPSPVSSLGSLPGGLVATSSLGALIVALLVSCVGPSVDPASTPSPGRVHAVIISSSARTFGLFASVVVPQSGLPLIAFFNAAAADLEIAPCENDLCSRIGPSTVVDHTVGTGLYASLALDSLDRPVLSYYDSVHGSLRAAFCGNPTCGGGSTVIRVLDDSGDVGRYDSMALGAQGFPLISYFDATHGDLKFLACLDASCGRSTTRTLDSGGTVGRSTSLTLDAHGNPLISYFDQTHGRLKVVSCADTTCLISGDTFHEFGGKDITGIYSSVGIGSDALPLIVSYDQTLGDLNLIQCGDGRCTGPPASIVTLARKGNVGLYASMVIIGGGNIAVSYFDESRGWLRVVACRVPTCSKGIVSLAREHMNVRLSSDMASSPQGELYIVGDSPWREAGNRPSRQSQRGE